MAGQASGQRPGLDLYAVRVALETHLFAALEPSFTAGETIIVQPGQDITPDLAKIQVIHSVSPGAVLAGELGGRQGICPRPGVYLVTLSSPASDTARLARAWRLCGLVERAFYRADLPADGGVVCCEEPRARVISSRNAGETDGRPALSVSIPWWVWTGGLRETETEGKGD